MIRVGHRDVFTTKDARDTKEYVEIARSLSPRKFSPLQVVVAAGQPTYGLCPKCRFMFLRDTLLVLIELSLRRARAPSF
jgi:hypothetical protein